MTFLVEMAPPGLGNLCQVLHSGIHEETVKSIYNLNINTALHRVLYEARVMAELSPMQEGKLTTPSPYS